jgi:hypothetical protein
MYKRSSNNWSLFFDLSNKLNNMKNLQKINYDFTPYTVRSLDMFTDGTSEDYVIYVVCFP